MLAKPEPPDEVVEQFIKDHPGGADFAEIAQLFGFSHQRCQMIVRSAIKKAYARMSRQNIWYLDDAL